MYSRHDLVWLSADAWRAADLPAAAAQWPLNDWPAVVRRRDADAGADIVCAGLPLPPDPHNGSKQRMAMQVTRAHITRARPPLPLSEAAPAAPPAWRDGLCALVEQASALTLRAYGSLAMEAITGLPYLTATSDIDLLFHPSTRVQFNAGLALLAKHADTLPLDGEIVFPDGAAVAWKEWLVARASGAHVLVKDVASVRLAAPLTLLASLP